MIPRIEPGRGQTASERSAFAVETTPRPLRLILDVMSISNAEAREALLDVCDSERLEVWSTERGTFEHFEVGAVVPGEDVAPLPIPGGFAGFIYPVSQYVRRAEEASASAEIGRDEALRLLLLAAGAASRQVDAFVTDHPFLLKRRTAAATRPGNTMSTREALALVGLYLRLRDDWSVGRVDDRYPGLAVPLGPFYYYWTLTRELLPAGWRWFSPCVYTQKPGLEDLDLLAGSAFERVRRALVARDRLHEQCKLPPSDRAGEEALSQLDVLIWLLDAALDVTARVAHVVYELPRDYRRATWRGRGGDWRRELGRQDAALAAVMDDGAETADIHDLVSLLRNTIHGEALRQVGHQSGGLRQSLIALPARERERFLVIIARRGGEQEWAVRQSGDDVYLEPDRFVERLLPPALAALNGVMERTAVERLLAPATMPVKAGPPDEFPFTAKIRRRLRLLGGFSD
jgi:hypothetical protein